MLSGEGGRVNKRRRPAFDLRPAFDFAKTRISTGKTIARQPGRALLQHLMASGGAALAARPRGALAQEHPGVGSPPIGCNAFS